MGSFYLQLALDLPPAAVYSRPYSPVIALGERMPEYGHGSRTNGRYRQSRRTIPDRLMTVAEMAELLGMHRDTVAKRARARDPNIPPGIQPGGPGTAWKFSERAYLHWLDLQTEREA